MTRTLNAQALSKLLKCVVILLFMVTIAGELQAQEGSNEAVRTSDTAASQPQGKVANKPKIEPVRTGSPRETIETFQRLSRKLESNLRVYLLTNSREHYEDLVLLIPQFMALIDLSSVPPASRSEVGYETTRYLLDIFGRIPPIDLETVPDEDAFDEDAEVAKWRIPRTPLKIIRIEDGAREGEFLFTNRTVAVAPRFFQRIEDLPLRSSLGFESWTRAGPQITGPMIPADTLTVVPDTLKEFWLDTPIWKVIATTVLLILALALLIIFHRVINRRTSDRESAALLRQTLTPIATIFVFSFLDPFLANELNISGQFSSIIEVITTVVSYFAVTWLVWLLIRTVFEWIIGAKGIPTESFDAHLWRLVGRTVGVIAGIVILADGAQELGLPLYSVLAGLGIGGLGVALAIRPTLENLIGGIILYIDQPIRVGDFCSFGDKTGTVEGIGVRSTKVRGLDRTLITVPNAALADMQLVNFAKCDRMLIKATIGLRYETEPDQLRYTLAKMREMLHAHPRIDRDTVRVRFGDYGASSLDVNIRIYALTQDWNDYFAIKEDILLRISEIVKDSGTSFAFPSQTLYLGRDDGLDEDRGEAAVSEVRAWRRSGQLPFPRMAHAKIDQLAGTLDYPPRGSVEFRSEDPEWSEVAEPLSAEPDQDDDQETEHKLKAETN